MQHQLDATALPELPEPSFARRKFWAATPICCAIRCIPNKTLQEREIAGIYFVARHGAEFLRDVYDSRSTPTASIIR